MHGCMGLFGKHIKCIRHEKPSKKRENLAPLLLTYIMPFCSFMQAWVFGNEANKRAVSERFLTAIKIGNLFIFHFISRSFLVSFRSARFILCIFLCWNMNFSNNKSIVQQTLMTFLCCF